MNEILLARIQARTLERPRTFSEGRRINYNSVDNTEKPQPIFSFSDYSREFKQRLKEMRQWEMHLFVPKIKLTAKRNSFSSGRQRNETPPIVVKQPKAKPRIPVVRLPSAPRPQKGQVDDLMKRLDLKSQFKEINDLMKSVGKHRKEVRFE